MKRKIANAKPYGEPRACWTIPREPYRRAMIHARTAGDVARGDTARAA